MITMMEERPIYSNDHTNSKAYFYTDSCCLLKKDCVTVQVGIIRLLSKAIVSQDSFSPIICH